MACVAIVPAKNRADTISATVSALRSVPRIDEILVVDDGSTDETGELARSAGAEVLRLDTNLGKGGAVAAAVKARPESDIYLLIDADLGETAVGAGSDLLNMAKPGS
ncbi:MAG: glycosyltransferase, partial [Acidimicrobiales bacterium]